MAWQLLTAVSVITFSISILLQRVLLHDDKSNPFAYAIVFEGMVGLLVGAYALVVGFQMPDFRALWFPILATCVLYGLGHIAYAHALQRVEASVFSILFGTRTFWIMLFGVTLFHEHLSMWQVVGSLLIFISICLVAERKGTVRLDRGVVLGLLTGLFIGLATAGWVYVSRKADVVTWTALSFIGPALVILIAQPRSVKHMSPLFQGKTLQKISLLAVLFSISSVTILEAFQSNVSLVAPLHATTIIVTVLLAIVFLRERTRLRWKAAAALVCFMGVLLLV